jgi:hypothetical protein
MQTRPGPVRFYESKTTIQEVGWKGFLQWFCPCKRHHATQTANAPITPARGSTDRDHARQALVGCGELESCPSGPEAASTASFRNNARAQRPQC